MLEVVPTVATTAHASVRSSASGRRRNGVVGRRLAQFELEQPAGLVDRRVRVLRADDDARAGLRTRAPRRAQRASRARHPPRGARASPAGSPISSASQREHGLLELLQGGRCAPEDADVVERRGEQLGEDARLGAGRREVREEARALPVRDAGQDHAVELVEQARERLALLGRRARQPRPHVAGLRRGRGPAARRRGRGSARPSRRRVGRRRIRLCELQPPARE